MGLALHGKKLTWHPVGVLPAQELKLFNCNDLINTDLGLWTLVGLCPQLRIISVEGINCRIPSNAAGELARLPKVRYFFVRCWIACRCRLDAVQAGGGAPRHVQWASTATGPVPHFSWPQLESLSLVGEEHSGQWIVGLDSLPPSWSALTALTCLELRGHQLLDTWVCSPLYQCHHMQLCAWAPACLPSHALHAIHPY